MPDGAGTEFPSTRTRRRSCPSNTVSVFPREPYTSVSRSPSNFMTGQKM